MTTKTSTPAAAKDATVVTVDGTKVAETRKVKATKSPARSAKTTGKATGPAKAARTPKADPRTAQPEAKPAATVEAAYTVTPANFWNACRDGALALVADADGIQSVKADNARRVLVLAGTKAGTKAAAADLARLWPAAVAALRQQDATNREAIREQRKTAEGRAARWANEQAYLTAFVASGGAL